MDEYIIPFEVTRYRYLELYYFLTFFRIVYCTLILLSAHNLVALSTASFLGNPVYASRGGGILLPPFSPIFLFFDYQLLFTEIASYVVHFV